MNFNIRIQLNALFFLLLINVAVYVFATGIQFLIKDIDTEIFISLGGLSVYDVVYKGKLWLLLTSNFFHLNIFHFILNMYSLVRIGEIVDRLYGGKKLFITYIIGGIGGGVTTVLISLFYYYSYEEPFFLSLGASASVFALVGLLLGGSLKKNRFGTSFPLTTSDLLPVILLSLFIGFVPGLNVNNWAHIGGLSVGFLLGLLMKHSMSGVETSVEKKLENVTYYFCIFLLVASYLLLAGNFVYLIVG